MWVGKKKRLNSHGGIRTRSSLNRWVKDSKDNSEVLVRACNQYTTRLAVLLVKRLNVISIYKVVC